jgi:AcrR family transcriptional regulator
VHQRLPSARERLLDATDLLFEEGVVGTPVDVLLQHAGVSPATMYAHFGSKDGLVAEALRRRLQQWDSTWTACVAAAGTPEERLLAVFDALRDFRRNRRGARWCAFLGTAAELGQADSHLREAIDADTGLLRSRLRELAVPVAGDGAAELAEQLLLVVTGALAMALRDPDPFAHIERGRRIARALVRHNSGRSRRPEL